MANPNGEEAKKEIELAKNLQAQGALILAKYGLTPTKTPQLSDAQWNFVVQSEKYDGTTDWKLWKQQFEYTVELVEADQLTMKKILIQILTKPVYIEVCNHLSKDIKEATYSEINASLEELYSKQVLPWVERQKFRFAHMEEGETVQKYFHRLKELAKLCKFANVDEWVRIHLVTGLRKEIFEKLCNKPDTMTLQEALTACTAAEFKVSNVEAIKNETTFHVSLNRRAKDRLGPHPKFKTQNTKKTNECYKCLGEHPVVDCPYGEYTCNRCKNKGHLKRACKSKARIDSRAASNSNKKWTTTKKVNEETESDDESSGGSRGSVKHLKANNGVSTEPIMLHVKIENVKLRLELDTGSRYNLLTKRTYEKYFAQTPLIAVRNTTLTSYTQNEVDIVGKCEMSVRHQNKVKQVNFMVVDKVMSSLLGREFMAVFGMKVTQWEAIKAVDSIDCQKEVRKLFAEFDALFANRVGRCKDTVIDIETNDTLRPVFRKPRPVPIAYREAVERQLDEWVRSGFLTKIDTCEYGTPLVVVKKKNGELRVCGDYKSTVNQHLRDFNYPIPTTDEIFDELSGCKYFFKLDLRSAYNQLTLSKKIVGIVCLEHS